jgi:hypothetical protein
LQFARFDLGNAPRFEVILLMEAHRLAVVGRIRPLYPKVHLVIRAAYSDRTKMIYFASLAFTAGEWSTFCAWHVERVTIGNEARIELFMLRIDSVLFCRLHAAMCFRVGAFPVLGRFDAFRALVPPFNGGHAERVRFPGSQCAIWI